MDGIHRVLCDPEIFVNSKGERLRYRLLKPLDYDSTKKYPIDISLPYGGQPPTDTIRQIEGAVAALLLTTADNRKSYPAFIFIPNCPPGAGWGVFRTIRQ
jgi:predicted peptidase